MKEIEKISAIILGIIIIAGLVVTFVFGLNYGQEYKKATQISAYLETDVNVSQVENIAKEIFDEQYISIQRVELFNDEVAVNVENTTDEQLETLASKLGEAYSLQLTTDDLEVVTIPAKNISDAITPYILPLIIALILIMVYMMIRYRKVGGIKVSLISLAMAVLGALLVLSVFAIFRIPVNACTLPITLIVILVLLTLTTIKYEKRI